MLIPSLLDRIISIEAASVATESLFAKLERLKSNEKSKSIREICIYTDSKSSDEAVQAKTGLTHQVSMAWLPGHCGIYGNEKASVGFDNNFASLKSKLTNSRVTRRSECLHNYGLLIREIYKQSSADRFYRNPEATNFSISLDQNLGDYLMQIKQTFWIK